MTYLKTCLSLVLLLSGAPTGTSQGAVPSDPLRDTSLRDRLVVKLRHAYPDPPDLTADVLDTTGDARLDQLLGQIGVQRTERVFRRPATGFRFEEAAREVGLDRWIVVYFDGDRADLDTLERRIAEHTAVEICERDQLGTVANTVPDDPDFPKQWALQNGKLNMPEAWDQLTTSTKIIAVLDCGTDQDHPDLAANLWVNPGEIPNNGIDDEGNGFIDDVMGWDFAYGDNDPEDRYGHGVGVMGVAGAVTNNTNQVAGVCWQVPLMNVQTANDQGGGTALDGAKGIRYAVDNGASVINMSWGFSSPNFVLETAVNYGARAGVVQVACAHNQGSTNPMYPAAYPPVMGIIATDEYDAKTSWSNYGSWCDMAAPGENIWSTSLNGGTGCCYWGTSFSTPFVAGAAALLLEANPSLDDVDVRWILDYSAVDLGQPGFDNEFGWGRLDVKAAMDMAMALSISRNRAKPGGKVTLDLDFPAEPNYLHVLLVSRNGRVPGIGMSGFDPTDYRQAAINPDALFWSILSSQPGGAGVFVDFVDVLDNFGHNQATLKIPKGPLFLGLDLDFVAFTFDPNNLSQVSSISGSNHLRIR